MLSLSQFGFYTICTGLRLGFVLCPDLHSTFIRNVPGAGQDLFVLLVLAAHLAFPRGQVAPKDTRLLPKQSGQRLQAESGPGNRRACDLMQLLDLSVTAWLLEVIWIICCQGRLSGRLPDYLSSEWSGFELWRDTYHAFMIKLPVARAHKELHDQPAQAQRMTSLCMESWCERSATWSCLIAAKYFKHLLHVWRVL